MISFYRKDTGDILIKQTGAVIRGCKTYEIWDDGVLAGKFYYGGNYSFIETAQLVARIDYERRFFHKSIFRIYNQVTGDHLGFYDFYDWNLSDARCRICFSDNTVYSFIANYDHRRVFKPSTWNLFRFDMTSSDVQISYFARSSRDFAGEIECNKKDCLFEIMTGFFVIEEKFRSDEDSSG